MTGFGLSAEMQKMVEDNGDKVGIHSAECVIWKAGHKNCKGCPYELGCGKSVRLMGIMLTRVMYKPRNFDDYERMHNRIQELLERTLKAVTTEELHAIPM